MVSDTNQDSSIELHHEKAEPFMEEHDCDGRWKLNTGLVWTGISMGLVRCRVLFLCSRMSTVSYGRPHFLYRTLNRKVGMEQYRKRSLRMFGGRRVQGKLRQSWEPQGLVRRVCLVF